MINKQLAREQAALCIPRVRWHILIQTSPGLEPYLDWVTLPLHCFLLICFRFDMLHPFLSTFRGWKARNCLGPCDCDLGSEQDLLHFILLCGHYDRPRRLYLKPVLKDLGFRQARVALLYYCERCQNSGHHVLTLCIEITLHA